MRKFALALLICSATLLVASRAPAATGSVRLAWNSCSAGPTDLAVIPGQTPIRLVASVTGQSDSLSSYDVWVQYGDSKQQVPDAWRFDPAGCQAGTFVALGALPPAALAKTCPAFQDVGGAGNSGGTVGDINFNGPASGYPTTLIRVVFADILLHPIAPNPAATYFMLGVEFDQSIGVTGPTTPGSTCGGLEDGICFTIQQTHYVHPDLKTETSFQIAPGGGMLSVNSPGGGCLVTPAHPATWGSIKAQYRD